MRALTVLADGRVALMMRETGITTLDPQDGAIGQTVDLPGPGVTMIADPAGGVHAVYDEGGHRFTTLDAALEPSCTAEVEPFFDSESLVSSLVLGESGEVFWAGMAEFEYNFQFGQQYLHVWGRLR